MAGEHPLIESFCSKGGRMPKIVKQFTKFVFPFKFDPEKIAPELATIKNKKGAEFKVFERFSQKTESLREGLDMMLREDGGSAKIADCYKLNINCRRYFSLPARKEEPMDFTARQAGASALGVAITELKLYFFESKIGFAEIECEYTSDEIEDYLELNYFICEAKSDKNRFVCHEKIWNEETKTKDIVDTDFTVEDLLDKLLSYASTCEGAVEFSYRKDKPMIYSHLLVDEKPEDINDLLQHLTKNYKESYRFDDSCTKIKSLHPFENSYWTGSLNGATNISFLTGDDITDNFFKENFNVKARNTYYFLFLNVLHQRHAVTDIMGRMGHLDRLVNDFYVMDKQLRQARKYEAEAINLKFRAFFKCPSTIEHVNDYYDMLQGAFQVGAFYDNFKADISSLQSICSKYVERINERDKKIKARKSAKTEIFVSIFAAIVAEVTLFNNSWALVEKVVGHSISFWNPGVLILCATLVSPLVTVFVNVNKQRGEIKRLTKSINEEQAEKLVEDDKQRRTRARFLAKVKKTHNKQNRGKKA